MHTAIMPAVLSGSKEELMAVQEMDEEVDVLYKHIVNYLANVSKLNLNAAQTGKLMKLMGSANDLEHIGDVIEVNMVDLGQQRRQKGFKVSQETQKVINTVHMIVSDALKAAIRAVVDDEQEYAVRVIQMQEDMDLLIEQADKHQVQRLACEDSGKFEAYSVEIEIIEKLKRIYYHANRMAKSVIEANDPDSALSIAA